MRALIGLSSCLAAACVFAAAAAADVGVEVVTHDVAAGGVIRGHGSGGGMPVYIVPARLAPHRYMHNGASYEPRSKGVPGPPFVFLGRLRRTPSVFDRQAFAFRVPRDVPPGLYKVFLYCRACGGSLIAGGLRYNGEVIRIR